MASLANTRPDPNGVDPAPPPELEVRAQMERILASPGFVASERLSRFLRWVVDRTLAGDSAALKEYSIGRDVFDRRDDYDPKVDSIVRVEAQRLRRKLRQYYDQEGETQPVRIQIPARGYVPVFSWAPGAAQVQEPAADLDPLTVAVLPFVHLGPDADDHLLCDGLVEEILTELARAPELKVLARGSGSCVQSAEMDVREIGRRLGAGTLVRGSVRSAGGRVRISAGAIDARSGQFIWSDVFDRDLQDIFAVQIEIAQAVSLKLRGATLPAPGAGLPAPAPEPEAYTMYLRGRREWRRMTIEGCRNAIAEYSRCIERYPDYAQPYASMAQAYNWMCFFGAMRPAEAILKARRSAVKALQLDPQCPDGAITLGGIVACIDFNWAEGERLVQRGVAMRPGNISALTSLAFHYAARGQVEPALAVSKKMVDCDPLSPEAQNGAVLAHYLARDYERSVRWLDRARQLGHLMPHICRFGARALIAGGRAEEAVRLLEQLQPQQPDPMLLGALAEAHALNGNPDRARELIARLEALTAEMWVPPLAFAYGWSGLESPGPVLDWLEKSMEAGDLGMGCIALDPRYDLVRAEPRFEALLKRMNLA